jgi:AcrR family transcriptional regulator
MVQVPKAQVRDAFVAAAASAFAELGYAATTMADVAARAGSSVGNLYKYFPGKQELLEAAVPPELVVELKRRTRARMRALGNAKDIRELGASAEYHALAGDLLDYCLAHRSAIVLVLARAEGTPHAGFAEDFVARLCEWALEYARGPYPELRETPALLFALEHAYRSFVVGVSRALLQFPDEAEARAVIAELTNLHQGGLKRLFESQGGSVAQPHHAPKSPVVSAAAGPGARNARPVSAGAGAARPGAGPADRPRRPRRCR